MAPLTLEAILELSNGPEPGARNASLIQAIGRLEFEAKMISKKRSGAKKAALAADKSRDTARGRDAEGGRRPRSDQGGRGRREGGSGRRGARGELEARRG